MNSEAKSLNCLADAATTAGGKRRPFQFSPLFLLAFVFVVALIARRVSDFQRQARQEREYFEDSQAMRGAGARYADSVRTVVFSSRATDESLAVFPHVIKRGAIGINLTDTQVTDAGILRIDDEFLQMSDWQGVPHLKLGNTAITSRALEAIGCYGKIVILDLHGTLIDDEGLEYLVDLPRLRSLNLRGTKITDAGLAHVGAMSNLRELDLVGTDIDGSGFRHLEKSEWLEMLVVEASQISDDSLAHLKNIKLRVPGRAIVLIAGDISDEQLAHVRELIDPISVDRLHE